LQLEQFFDAAGFRTQPSPYGIRFFGMDSIMVCARQPVKILFAFAQKCRTFDQGASVSRITRELEINANQPFGGRKRFGNEPGRFGVMAMCRT
jgi:hypothetical protein